MNVQSVMANFDSLAATLKQSVNTDIPLSQMPKLLSLADSVDTKNIRSFVFSPPFYGSDGTEAVRGYVIEPNIARIRRAVKDAFSTPASVLALRDRLGAEEARVWVLNGSGRSGLSASTADRLAYDGLDASAPNQRVHDAAGHDEDRRLQRRRGRLPGDDQVPRGPVQREGRPRRPTRACPWT